jgi:hypothetical protein
MTQTIDAIFEDGAFHPVRPDQVLATNGQLVTLVVQAPATSDTEDLPEPLRLAARVYDGLSEEEIQDIETVVLDRTNFNDGRKSGP